MPLFFTSDWHCYHKNVIRFANRPFKDLTHMHETFIHNYNNTVPPHGTCYFLGDMGFGSNEGLNKILDRLHGNKILIVGNHDKGQFNMNFNSVLYSALIYAGDISFSMSHCPLKGIPREDCTNYTVSSNDNWHGETLPKMQKFITNEKATYHLHGHIHSPNRGNSQRIEGNQFDVGVDANDNRPLSLGKIYSLFCQRNKNANK